MEQKTNYAVIKIGAHQFNVSEGSNITINRLAGQPGDSVTLEEVLLYNDGGNLKIGTPIIGGGKVTAKIVEHLRGDKVWSFKKRRRKGFKKLKGHRQELTTLLIEKIAA